MLQLTVEELELKLTVNYINFNVNILDEQLLKVYNLYKKNLKL